jgi:hypothetical protein
VLKTIEPLLDDYEFGGLQIKYVRTDKTPSVARLIQTLKLELVELSQFTRIASDGFHDVALPEPGMFLTNGPSRVAWIYLFMVLPACVPLTRFIS